MSPAPARQDCLTLGGRHGHLCKRGCGTEVMRRQPICRRLCAQPGGAGDCSRCSAVGRGCAEIACGRHADVGE